MQTFIVLLGSSHNAMHSPSMYRKGLDATQLTYKKLYSILFIVIPLYLLSKSLTPLLLYLLKSSLSGQLSPEKVMYGEIGEAL